jgi:hypothetical protein
MRQQQPFLHQRNAVGKQIMPPMPHQRKVCRQMGLGGASNLPAGAKGHGESTTNRVKNARSVRGNPRPTTEQAI